MGKNDWIIGKNGKIVTFPVHASPYAKWTNQELNEVAQNMYRKTYGKCTVKQKKLVRKQLRDESRGF